MGAIQSAVCGMFDSPVVDEQEITESQLTQEITGNVWKVGLGAGCYWGTEKFISHQFPKRKNLPEGKIVNGEVGFMGPKNVPANPSYKEVCTGKTGHVEVYHVEFEGGAAYFEEMIKYFFMFHDPTTKDRQGGDTGTQYASVIYCYNKEQMEIANKVKQEVQTFLNEGHLKKAYASVRVSTAIRFVESPFFAAHKEHQDYLTENPQGYCNHGMKFKVWPENVP